MTPARTVINTLDLSGAPEAVAAVEAVGKLISLPAERDLVLARIGEADAYLASASVRIDEEFLAHASRLRLIGSPSTGTDHMDLDAIRAAGVEMYDIAREFDLINSFTATSELAFGLLLSLVRHLPPAFVAAKQGDWARERYSGFQLAGKTLAVLGLGRLGKITARIGNGFGMSVIACDPADVSAPDVEMVSFDELLDQADVLSIHLHLTSETDGLIDARCLAQMKPSALLLNTSRGRVVDEYALLEALKERTIAGAGLDVVDGEWLNDDKLQAHPLLEYARANGNLLITPHIGGATSESIYGARVFMARRVADYLQAPENTR